MQGRVIRAAAVVYVVLKAAGVSAAPTLTYNSPILAATPGSTVLIGATLSLAPTDDPIHTGFELSLGQPEDINAFSSAPRPTTLPRIRAGLPRLRTRLPT